MTALTSPRTVQTRPLGRTVLTGCLSLFIPTTGTKPEAQAKLKTVLKTIRPILKQYSNIKAPRLTTLEGHRIIKVEFFAMPWRLVCRLEDALIAVSGCQLGKVYQLQRMVTA